MKKKITVYLKIAEIDCWCVSEFNLQKLAVNFPDYEICFAADESEFLKMLIDAEIAVTWKFLPEWAEKFPELRLIATPAAGDDWVKVPLSFTEKIKVIHGSFHGQIMAETAIGMLLAHSRQLYYADYMMKHSCVWPRNLLDKKMKTLGSSHVLILGLGSIGMVFAKMLKAFGCRITGVKQSVADKPDFMTTDDKIITVDEFKNSLYDVDHLVSILPAKPETDDIIDKEIFAALPSTAAVYNLGRGNAVNESDLVEALVEDKIAAAYLDVFKTEPLPAKSPLRTLPNLYIYPHSSAITPEYLDLYFEELVHEIKVFLNR